MGTIEQLFRLTADRERARSFYEDALGLTPARVGETSVTYDTGGCELKLQQDFEPGVMAEFGLDEPPAGDRGAGGVSVLSVEEPLPERYEHVREALQDGPGEVRSEPRDVPWGERMFLVADPDGYVWEVRSSE